MPTTSDVVELLGGWASPFSNRVEMALHLKSIHYEFIQENIYTDKSERLLKANPVHKKIPVLIHNQNLICESAIIIQYIDETWASNNRSILPSDPFERAKARFLAAYIDDKLFPLLKELRKELGVEARAEVIREMNEGVGFLEEAFVKCSKGKAFFGGDDVGYVDIVLGSYLGWTKVTELSVGLKLFDEIKSPGLAGWVESFRSHGAVKDVLPEAHRLTEFYMMTQAAAKA